jgi:hypothetical protein
MDLVKKKHRHLGLKAQFIIVPPSARRDCLGSGRLIHGTGSLESINPSRTTMRNRGLSNAACLPIIFPL